MLSVIACVQGHILVDEVLRTGLHALRLNAHDHFVRDFARQVGVTAGTAYDNQSEKVMTS